MRLLELTTQATVGFSPASKSKLAAGYNLLMPPASQITPLAELLSALFYSDGRGGDGALAAGQDACALVVFQAANGAMYRLVRQLGGRGALQQWEAPRQAWREICQEARDITSVLRSSCGLPTKGQFESIFCFSPTFTLPAIERDRGPSIAGAGFGLGQGALGGFGGSAPLAAMAVRGAAALPATGLPLSGPGRALSSPGRALPLPSATMLPPLPPEEAQAIRDKLMAEIAAGKALDEWQFELEGLQQKLFLHRERLEARQQIANRLASCEADLRALGPSPEARGIDPAMLERAFHFDAALKRRETGLRDLREEARKLQERRAALCARPPWLQPKCLASGLAGLVCLVVGIAFYGNPLGLLALLSIVAFGYPALCCLGWIDESELCRGIERRAQRLKEGEQKLVEAFERDYGPAEGVLRALGMASGQEVREDQQRRQACGAALREARAALARFEADPGFQQSREEVSRLEAAVSELEKKIESVALQTTRDHHVAESELKALEARQNQPMPARRAAPDSGAMPAASPSLAASSDSPLAFGTDGRIPALIKLALDLWPGARLETMGPALRDRVGQFWAALTGRSECRIEFNAKAELTILGPDGALLSPEMGGDRELLFWSVRLALLEKILPARPIPLVLEEPCAGWPEPRARLFSKALIHLSRTTQILHVSALKPQGDAPGSALCL